MKKTIILILTLSLTLGVFSSCGHKTVDPIDYQTSSSPSEDTSAESLVNDATESNQTNKSEHTDTDGRLTDIEVTATAPPDNIKYVSSYEIKKIGDKWYIIFDSYETPKSDYDDAVMYGRDYATMADFKAEIDRLLSGNLDLGMMQYIVKHFKRDEIGIPIADFSTLYVTNLSGISQEWETVTWYEGEIYSPGVYMLNDQKRATLTVTNEEEFSGAKIDNSYYAYNRTIESNGKTVKVYSHKSKDNSSILLVKEGKLYYKYVLSGISATYTDEYLLSFGLQKYEG
jgi:hypothetical protein